MVNVNRNTPMVLDVKPEKVLDIAYQNKWRPKTMMVASFFAEIGEGHAIDANDLRESLPHLTLEEIIGEMEHLKHHKVIREAIWARD